MFYKFCTIHVQRAVPKISLGVCEIRPGLRFKIFWWSFFFSFGYFFNQFSKDLQQTPQYWLKFFWLLFFFASTFFTPNKQKKNSLTFLIGIMVLNLNPALPTIHGGYDTPDIPSRDGPVHVANSREIIPLVYALLPDKN